MSEIHLDTQSEIDTDTNALPIPESGNTDAIFSAIWAWLESGAADRRSATHLLTMATVTPRFVPAVRTMVLQEVDKQNRSIFSHTHRLAEKLEDLLAQPKVAWHVYDRRSKTQLVMHGNASVHFDGKNFANRWDAVSRMSRVCYERSLPPRQPLAGSEVAAVDGRDHFAVIQTRIDQIEYLHLKHDGHRGIRFDWTGGGWNVTELST